MNLGALEAADVAVDSSQGLAGLVRSFADEYGEPSDADAATVSEYLRRSGVGALLAESGGVPLGLLAHNDAFSIGRGGAYAMIDDLVVRPNVRRRGVATALLSAALDGFAARGLDRAVLWMQRDSLPAMRLCEGRGFSVTGTLLIRHAVPVEPRGVALRTLRLLGFEPKKHECPFSHSAGAHQPCGT